MKPIHALILFFTLSASLPVLAADQPQWGEKHTRNLVSTETGLPASFDPESGANVKWSVELGTRSYATPVIADGRVYVGTNNEAGHDERFEGDYGLLLCLSEEDGSMLWQLSVPKLPPPRDYQDWPNTGIASPAAVEAGVVYLVNNRNEIMALDADGQADGNDGPFTGEAQHMAPDGAPPMAVTGRDADLLWVYDLQAELGVAAHDAAHCAVLLHGPYLYASTSNGVDAKHDHMVATDAPSLVVLEKRTGQLVARDREPIGPNIVHSTWSSPALVTVDGRDLVVFAGGDGACYGFEPIPFDANPGETPLTLKRAWRFELDPEAPREDVHSYRGNRDVSASNVYGMPVVAGGRIHVAFGGDFWHGKKQSWLACFDPRGSGDITEMARLWSAPLREHCLATPAIRDGLVFIADTSGRLHCLDAETGNAHWTHDTHGVCWGSPLVADGKVWQANQKRQVLVFAARREKELLAQIDLREAINASPVAANGTLYITTMTRLYAIAERKR